MTQLRNTAELIAISIVFILLAAFNSHAATLRWGSSSGSPDGYKVYYGTSANNLSKSKDVGNKTAYNLDKLPLSENVRYYFSVSAYNAAGESAPCPPVVYMPGDTTPPSPPSGLVGNSPSDSTTNGYELALSTRADRSNASPLDGLKTNGNVFIFLDTEAADIAKVTFRIDGVEMKVEKVAPYDLAGGESSAALPFNTNQLPDGNHNMEAHIQFDSGSTKKISAPFSVRNNSATPSPYNLALSTRADRSNASTLDGLNINGNVFIFLDTEAADIAKVTFLIDGVEMKVEKIAPYDLAGGESSAALPFNTNQLSNSNHEIVAKILLHNGNIKSTISNFYVNN